MMCYCCVEGCKSSTYNDKTNRFFKVPLDASHEWLRVINRDKGKYIVRLNSVLKK